MAQTQSYIPQGTCVICTNMTGGQEQKLQVLRPNARTFTSITGSREPVLNSSDRKLSAAFQCKNAQEFWGGLASLCLGIAVCAIAVAAIVTTGPLAIAAIAVAGAAIVGSVAADITGMATMNSCDKCLQQWNLTHTTVRIEGAQALLQNSFLECKKGGVLTIVLDPAVAREAAKIISDNNNQEISDQMKSEFFQGIVTIAAASIGLGQDGIEPGGPAGLVSAAVIAPAEYWYSEDKREDERAAALDQAFSAGIAPEQPSVGSQIGDNAVGIGRDAGASTPGAGIDAINDITAKNQAISKEATEYAEQAFERSLAGDEEGAEYAQIASDMATHAQFTGVDVFKSAGSSLGIGIAGGMVNAAINIYAGKKEDALYGASVEESLMTVPGANILFLNQIAQQNKKMLVAQTQ